MPLSASVLAQRAAAAMARLAPCTLCARRCGADRLTGAKRPACGIGRLARIENWAPGIIRFAGCNLRCLYCPRPEAAWEARGTELDAYALADMLLAMETPEVVLYRPSHVAAQVLEALAIAVARGFDRRLVWDSNGFDAVETLALLDGVVDEWRCDMRYADSAVARQCSGVSGYAETNKAVVAQMHRQGPLTVRHLVLPNGLSGVPDSPPGVKVVEDRGYQPLFRAARHAKLRG